MRVSKVFLKDSKNVYLFTNKKEVYINGNYEGNGVLITPVTQLTITKVAYFILNGKKFKTNPLLGCYVTQT